MIWLFIGLYIIILLLELPALIKKRWYKEIVVLGVLFFISIYMGMVQLYQWPIYNPFKAILPYIASQ